MTLTDTLWLALVLLGAAALVSGVVAWGDRRARKRQALLDRREALKRRLHELTDHCHQNGSGQR